ncbi:hypothetical protein AB751O23_AK_00270 [Chlamydiales bacterium SCGC AB-751-O23]|nr:hypothetical protein AB751O23_AK_00270 [Chlamydiales bacterium SCGC AB-751-O23]
MFTLSWTYILLAVGAAISRKILGRNHQALKDFEPEDEL